jgi:succinate dehydrogenase/fumarate reductase cytochrome b subunit
VAVGIGVVWARRWSLGQLGESPRVRRISRLVTVVSAVVIIVLGIGICYNAVHGGPPG